MKRLHAVHTWAILVALLAIPAMARADYLTVRMPSIALSQSEYFHELLYTALEQAGHLPAIERIDDFPHLRSRDMLEHGNVSVLWLVRSDKRDERYLPVPVELTGGLVGKRILLVAPDQIDAYCDVTDLGQFRRLGKVGGFGTDWFDVDVWNENFLPYKEVADPALIYGMVESGDRGVDYFSRGFNEIVGEQRDHPELAIEPNLMFEYDRDFIFYVTPTRPELVPILTEALTKARDSGLMDRLVKKHWARNFDILKPETRTVIRLRTPK